MRFAHITQNLVGFFTKFTSGNMPYVDIYDGAVISSKWHLDPRKSNYCRASDVVKAPHMFVMLGDRVNCTKCNCAVDCGHKQTRSTKR